MLLNLSRHPHLYQEFQDYTELHDHCSTWHHAGVVHDIFGMKDQIMNIYYLSQLVS